MVTNVDELPVVTVWAKDGTDWLDVGQVSEYTTLDWSPTFNDLGSWSATIPWGEQAEILAENKAGLLTIDWRTVRTTWTLSQPKLAWDDEQDQIVLTMAGVAALQRLAWDVAWWDPSKPLDSQPVLAPDAAAPYRGVAETVIKQIVAANTAPIVASGSTWVRSGVSSIVVPASAGLGSVVTARPGMDNLLELVQNLATVGGVGVALNLVNSTDSRADLVLQVWKPTDQSDNVILSTSGGDLSGSEQSATEPTATMAIVGGAGTGGADRVFAVATTPDSVVAAGEWGGHRVTFVDGPSSFDPAELQQAGVEAIAQGAATQHLVVTGADIEGVQAYRDYLPGDTVPWEIVDQVGGTGQVVYATGAAAVTSMPVSVNTDPQSEEPLIVVSATVGDPSANNPDAQLDDDIRQLSRGLARQERK